NVAAPAPTAPTAQLPQSTPDDPTPPAATTPLAARVTPLAAAAAAASPGAAAQPADDPTIEAAAITAPPPDDTHPTQPTSLPPTAWTQTAPWPSTGARTQRRDARRERRAQRPRSFLTPLTLSVLLIGAGVTFLLQATGALDVNLTVALAIGTCVVGAALVV